MAKVNEETKKLYESNGFSFAKRIMNKLLEKVLDAYFHLLINIKGNPKFKTSQLIITQ